ncbi:mannose-1-phosphate guanylyltransferase [Paenibacillus cellulosilyticus]|uniref:Mannose-1-phosphate guanylyltransferase n=1 Tax=Paenibacillus cellulosilyticus TaxID=375489 RepID=A0A2V2Z0Z8_9BACL|nr:sugar phosphate nucleotidyltransferase [Paenibacillus cellulosilyticus]PWW08472.1 mannose-1-phosphate guanylyltransferase [Paenibacillus cellulosilyticus]QKS48057.1 mannose-1-phosphate guanylyltransferase [Paenibacillus cellulosilyticus]
MKLVLLSGGSGKRLWPLSNDARSKQFLKVLKNEDQELVSMVQRVWGQIDDCGLVDCSYIATGKAQIEMMHNQIGPSVPLIIEPERRDTFPAIALSASYLYSVAKVALDEVIAVLPVDPYVEGHFFYTVKRLEKTLQETEADLALIGVKPTYPSAKYGYIIPEREQNINDGLMKVSHFQEKPSEKVAVGLIEQQALWNCGVFSFRLGYLINILKEKGYPLEYNQLVEQYHKLPKISFDYEVVEKTQNIVVVPYSGYWKDLGTWNTLTEEMGQNQIGRGTISEDCINTHLVNELEIPVTVLGVPNVVVAVSPDGILVSDKGASPRIKDYINYEQGPMFEEREWGWVRILDNERYEDGRTVITKRVAIKAARNLSYLMHLNREEVWTIVKGEGEFVQNGISMKVKAGNVLHIPMKTLHGLKANTDIEMIVVHNGYSDEDKVMELYSSWSEMTKHCLNI